MEQEKEKIIDKVKKLLRLATSDNVNEAASSAAKAQELIDKYNLSYLLLSDSFHDNEIKDAKESNCVYKFGKNIIAWKSVLAKNIGEMNHCRIYIGNTGQYKYVGIVGREEDINTVKYLFLYLATEIERLCLREGVNQGKTWRNNFRLGAIEYIANVMAESSQKSKQDFQKHCNENNVDKQSVSTALLKFDSKLQKIDDYIKENMKFAKSKKIKSDYDHGARLKGYKAASEININNKSLENSSNLQLKN